MRPGYEWQPAKEESNFRKHGVTFSEASTVFDDPLSRTLPDSEHSDSEERFITIGTSESGCILVVCHCDRGVWIRIISARHAESHERRDYHIKA
jgi:hypothetical protein